jgi:hypothetical protein
LMIDQFEESELYQVFKSVQGFIAFTGYRFNI